MSHITLKSKLLSNIIVVITEVTAKSLWLPNRGQSNSGQSAVTNNMQKILSFRTFEISQDGPTSDKLFIINCKL